MAKEKTRSNKEIKKPKKVKTDAPATAKGSLFPPADASKKKK